MRDQCSVFRRGRSATTKRSSAWSVFGVLQRAFYSNEAFPFVISIWCFAEGVLLQRSVPVHDQGSVFVDSVLLQRSLTMCDLVFGVLQRAYRYNVAFHYMISVFVFFNQWCFAVFYKTTRPPCAWAVLSALISVRCFATNFLLQRSVPVRNQYLVVWSVFRFLLLLLFFECVLLQRGVSVGNQC